MVLISRLDQTVPVTVQSRTAVGPARAFEVVVPVDLSVVFRPWGPFPGVRGVRNQTGSWDRVGVSRNPNLTDGSTVTETLTEYDPGHSFAYELTDFTNLLGRLVVGVRGEWTFTSDGCGTLIRWTYEFKPRPGVRGLVRLGLAPVWRCYMLAALDRTITVVEQIAT